MKVVGGVFAVALLFGLTSCGQSPAPASTSSSDWEADWNALIVSTQQTQDVTEIETIEDVVASGAEGLWVESGKDSSVNQVLSSFTSDDELLYFENGDSNVEAYFGDDWGYLYEVASGDYLHVSKSAGDRLLAISSASKINDSHFRTIGKSGYCQSPEVTGNLGDYEEVDGVDTSDYGNMDIESARQIESAIGVFSINRYQRYLLCSDVSRTLDASWYEGTAYKEGILRLMTPYVFPENGNSTFADIAFEKTKEGYLVVDISDLQPGLYAVCLGEDSSPWYTNYVVYIDE